MSASTTTRLTTAARLVVLVGLPGAGKTTLAEWLRDAHGFTIASRDAVRAAMFPACRFTGAEKDAAFQAMKAAIAIMLDQGLAVVTDGMCFSSRTQLDEVVAIAARAAALVDILECACPVAVAQARVETDRLSDPTVPADRDSKLVQQVADRFDSLPETVLRLQTNRSLPDIRSDAARLLALVWPA